MREKRNAHGRIISKHQITKEMAESDTLPIEELSDNEENATVIMPKYQTKKQGSGKDDEYFIPYAPKITIWKMNYP